MSEFGLKTHAFLIGPKSNGTAHFISPLQKGAKTAIKMSLPFLPNNNDTDRYSCILSSWENGIALKMLVIPREDISSSHDDNPFQGVFKVISRKGNLEYLENLRNISARFLRSLKWTFSSKSCKTLFTLLFTEQ